MSVSHYVNNVGAQSCHSGFADNCHGVATCRVGAAWMQVSRALGRQTTTPTLASCCPTSLLSRCGGSQRAPGTGSARQGQDTTLRALRVESWAHTPRRRPSPLASSGRGTERQTGGQAPMVRGH